MRVCPACDTRTEARICARDGRPTVDEAELATVERHDPLIGYKLLGKYEVEKKLGSGGFGSVYRARHLQTGGHVAVKLLRPEIAEDADAVRRFYIEAQNTHKLKHPNTVTVSDFGRADDGLLYLIMEHVDGMPLMAALRAEGRLAPARVVHITEQVLKSLHEAHGYRIVHRDIKPENIMLLDQFLERDFVKVLDFGISRSLDSTGANTAGRALGTPRYMAPEQWRGQELDGRADIYSIGCMAYQMLAGRAPFHFEKGTQSGIYAYMHAHLHAPPPPLSEVAPGACPPELEALILAMLAKDRCDRPASAQDVLMRLAQLKSAVALSASTTGHVAATTSDALPGFGVADTESNFTAQLSVGPIALAPNAAAPVAAAPRGGHTTPLPSPSLSEPQPTLRPRPRAAPIAARLPENSASTGIPPRSAFPPLEPTPPVSTAAVVAALAALLLMAGGAGYWLTRGNSSSVAEATQPARAAAAELASAEPPTEQPATPNPSTPAPAEPAEAAAAPAAEAAAIPFEEPAANPTPEPAAADPEPAAAADPAADPGDAAPAILPEPAEPEPPTPAPVVIRIASDPPGAKVRRKGSPKVLGTTPFNWTLEPADLKKLTAAHPIPLNLTHPDGQTGTADLTSDLLDAETPELTATLTAPKPRPHRAAKAAASKPSPKPKPKSKAKGAFHF